MNKIIEELKDIYHTLEEAEFVINDSIAKGKFCLCQLKLKQVIRTLKAKEKLTDKIEIIDDTLKEKEERLIQIPLEEYKELLVIKGRYEELVKKEIIFPNETITYINGIPVKLNKEADTYKVTCNMESNGE